MELYRIIQVDKGTNAQRVQQVFTHLGGGDFSISGNRLHKNTSC